MPRVQVARFDIGERAAAKFWAHGIRTDEVEAVLEHRWVVTRNRAGHAAPFLLIGQDNQGRCLTIPIFPTADPLVWRPVTAWPCKPGELAKLR